MFSKKFYDIFTIIFFILIIGMFVGSYFLLKGSLDEAISGGTGDPIGKVGLIFTVLNGVTSIILLIYWILILILAVQLHKQNYSSVLDIIIIAIFVPFAPFLYLFTLRGHLKKFEMGSQTQTPTNNISQ